MPKPNRTPAAMLIIQWMLGEFVYANQKRLIGRKIEPISVGGRQASGSAILLCFSLACI